MQQTLSNQQLTDIAHEFGSPVYVYHAERITEQYNKLKNAFKSRIIIIVLWKNKDKKSTGKIDDNGHY